jgi:coenzyme F420 hydrogenase subunit beta
MKFKNVTDVARWRLCVGCGACAFVCPEKRLRLIDIEDEGLRPIMLEGPDISPTSTSIAVKEGLRLENGKSGECGSCLLCLEVCPGMTMVTRAADHEVDRVAQLENRWGVVLEVWEGYAADEEIRFSGASGGLCSALPLFCIEKGYASGVVHVSADSRKPWVNRTVISTGRKDLIRRSGSRYSPASPCAGLSAMKSSPNPLVFMGKPCDVAGLRMAQEIYPVLKQKTHLALGFFCAGTPSTKGTLDLLHHHNLDLGSISELRYRGLGWPGSAAVWEKGGKKPALQVSYEESWGFLQKYRPFRCYLCPDITGEFADISVGDPWYRAAGEGEPGRSLILIRTKRGRAIFHQAMEKGYVKAEPADPEVIYQSQKSLLGKRQAIWGRLLAMKLLGIPRPELRGFHLLENWLGLSSKEKARSVLGTIRRIIQRNYFSPATYEEARNLKAEDRHDPSSVDEEKENEKSDRFHKLRIQV